MKRKKISLLIVCTVLCALLFCGCAQKTTETPAREDAAPAAAETEIEETTPTAAETETEEATPAAEIKVEEAEEAAPAAEETEKKDTAAEETVSAEEAQSGADLYTDFLENGEYRSFFSDRDCAEPTEYAVLDINADGTDELILSSEDGSGFYRFCVFGCDASTGRISAFSFAREDVFDENLSDSVNQYYGTLRYSPEYRALVFTEMNNGIMFGSLGYWTAEEKNLSVCFTLSFEQDYETGEVSYSIYDPDSQTETGLRSDAYYAYIEEAAEIAFEPLP